MTGEFLTGWVAMTISLFNTILLLWLGLTVLLNVERRTWGVWLASGGLLMGAAFFVIHSAMLGNGLTYVGPWMDLWWHLGWVPAVALPFSWYVVMLWYGGFWDDRGAGLFRRQVVWFSLTLLLAAGLGALLLFADPLPSYSQIARLNLANIPSVRGIPIIAIIYPAYILLCMGLSLDALRSPTPSGRVMGDLARRRARPWLVATSLVLLTVSVLVGMVMGWAVFDARGRPLYEINSGTLPTIFLFDAVVGGLIAISIILVGQAIVSYEIFTGKTLPRRGLMRQWRSAVVLAAGYGAMVTWSLTRQWHPIYALLLAAGLMTVFYALFSWRSYRERERYIEHLRPFVTSRGLYEDPMAPASDTHAELDVAEPFRALCGDVLGARAAYLVAVGPLSPLSGVPLTYPISSEAPTISPAELAEVVAQAESPTTMFVSLDPVRYRGAMWGVPLWSERGLTGMLMLGEKRDGGLYTQEEIEVARATGERLIDTQASAELARRVMALQRHRLAESQVLDRRARRVLHDDVLPLLHTAMLAMSSEHSGKNGASPDSLALLADAHRRIADLLHEMPSATAPEIAKLGLVGALKRSVEEELGSAFDGVTWEIDREAAREARAMPPLTAEVLYYAAREAIRNAARYARSSHPARPLHLRVEVSWQGGFRIAIEDDGVGLGAAETASGGSGQGLALHSTMMAVVGGSLAAESVPGRFTRVVLTLPQAAWAGV